MSEKVRFGPANPHPLAQLKTELVWEGKYDEVRKPASRRYRWMCDADAEDRDD